MSLRPYQEDIIRHVLQHPRSNLFVPMGAGKTVAVLSALDTLEMLEGKQKTLVIAPLRVAVSTWPAEIKKWRHLSHLRVSVITGSPAAREKALERDADVYCINYDNLIWLVDHLAGAWPFQVVVADECTRLKGLRSRQGSKRAGALARVAFRSARYIGLTGTPAANGVKDMWGITWFLDQGARLGKSYQAFMNRWFYNAAPWSNFPVYEPLPHAQAEVQQRVADLCISVDLKDYLDIKEPIVSEIEVELPRAAREVYDAMWKEMVVELKKDTVTAVNAAVKTAKVLQIASGALYTDDKGSWEEVHRAKIEALDSIIEEANGAPVLVAYHFKSDLVRLQKAFPQGRVLDANPKTIDEWNAGKIPVLFAHPASAGHGLNLQDGGNIIAFFSLNWNLEEHLQIIERIGPTRQAQAGHDRPVFVYYILAADTIDQVVRERLKGKRSVVELMLEAMKR